MVQLDFDCSHDIHRMHESLQDLPARLVVAGPLACGWLLLLPARLGSRSASPPDAFAAWQLHSRSPSIHDHQFTESSLVEEQATHGLPKEE